MADPQLLANALTQQPPSGLASRLAQGLLNYLGPNQTIQDVNAGQRLGAQLGQYGQNRMKATQQFVGQVTDPNTWTQWPNPQDPQVQQNVHNQAMNLALNWNPAAMGIIAGKNALTANLPALSHATVLERQGINPESIWNQTGWFRDKMDGNWKFEIPDNAAKLTYDPVHWSERGGMGGVDQIFQHDDLYNAYPVVKNINMVADVPENTYQGYRGGSFSPNSNYISMTAFKDEVPSVTLHELQHAVQRQEGFAVGGSPETVADDVYAAANLKLSALSEQMDNLKSAMQNVRDPSARLKLSDKVSQLKAEYDNVMSEKLNFDARAAYRRLAGEIEARNVQKRMNMTSEERLKTPPWMTQDVPSEQAIVRMK